MDYATLAPVLKAIARAEAHGEPLGRRVLGPLADELGMTELGIQSACAYVHATGLAHLVRDSGEVPAAKLMNAGRQYLALRGEVDRESLSFLPYTIDDLHARRALVRAGALLVDEFRHALVAGRAREHAATLVPAAFAQAVDDRIAVDLYAAAVALVVRLEAEQPPACVAEEILALELIAYADSWLAVEAQQETLGDESASRARAELPSLLGLFYGSEVLRMADWKEPADAALALHVPSPEGKLVDQRIEAWFRPFAGAAATGYLIEPAER